jgi:hypothetical protein
LLAIAGVTAPELLELELLLALLLDLLLLPQPAAMARHASIAPALTSFVFTILLLTCVPPGMATAFYP